MVRYITKYHSRYKQSYDHPFSQFTVNVMKLIQPTVIFSAHDHRGMDYVGTRKTGRSTGNITWFSQNKPETEEEFLVLKPPSSVAGERPDHRAEIPTASGH